MRRIVGCPYVGRRCKKYGKLYGTLSTAPMGAVRQLFADGLQSGLCQDRHRHTGRQGPGGAAGTGEGRDQHRSLYRRQCRQPHDSPGIPAQGGSGGDGAWQPLWKQRRRKHQRRPGGRRLASVLSGHQRTMHARHPDPGQRLRRYPGQPEPLLYELQRHQLP